MSANNFYFSNATFDYYLSKNPNNTSHMEVEEQLTAVFPETNQNHGIERCLPKHYRGVKTLDASSFRVSRAGTAESYSTYDNEDLLCFRIGSSSSYVHGEQTYSITYSLNNVILEPNNATNQELYWDTNGTGWSQSFSNLSATVHLSADLTSAFTQDTACYVGVYGAGGTEATSRCQTTQDAEANTITFSATDLAARENLTLVLGFAPDTFVVPKDLSAYFTAAGIALLAGVFAFFKIRAGKRAKARNAEKLALAKSPKPVQYTPPSHLTVAESQKLWLNANYLDAKVASLMELAVHHHIELERAEKTSKILKHKSYVWKIHCKSLSGISREQAIVLEILNGGNSVQDGDTIEVKTQKYSSKLERLSRSFDTETKTSLRQKGLFSEKKDQKLSILAAKYNKYEERTLKGIETSNYLDGLEEYIKLAEKDRIKFLHSVKTADTSPQGLVKLYEKLLPYAIIFKCEDSWLAELNQYYQMPEVGDPDWLMAGYIMSGSDFRTFRTATMSSISSATAAEASSSSGSSGLGGGGFSGGGGGGGGGGGW
ncbi:DUF2207 domain-containing protein [Candidatus Saccharibacteria bacterium]|nr:DUF2207 domain-containing protein [Candidatus Saccharibacteria bacterium]